MNDRWRELNANMHQYAPLHTSMGQHCSLSAVQRKRAFGGTVMMGLNWKCLDQCHGVRSHGKSSSQSWRKTVVQSKFDPWVHILALFSPKVIYAGLPAKAFPRNQALVDISVLLWLRKQRPSFAQGQPKGYFQLKEPHRTTKKYSQMNADWKVEKAQYAEFNVRRCGKIAVWQLCRERTVMVAWTYDVWINAMVFVPMAQAPPKAGANLLYSLRLIHESTSLFSPKVTLAEAHRCFCRHQFFSAVAQGTAKIRPRVIFNWKNFIEQLKFILKWMLIESWRRLNMRSSVRKHVARLQFDRCAEKDSPCGTVMMARITSVFY